jgi:hypothetical protein
MAFANIGSVEGTLSATSATDTVSAFEIIYNSKQIPRGN